jgi:hypothetical protein
MAWRGDLDSSRKKRYILTTFAGTVYFEPFAELA